MKTLLSRLQSFVGRDGDKARLPLIICGLGYEHYRLQTLVSHSPSYEVLAVIDDFPWNHGTFVEGARVYYPSETLSLVEKHGVAALLYCQDSDLAVFDATTRTALANLRVPFLKLDPGQIDDITLTLNSQLMHS